nr:hypothetical protein Iba_chr07aCG0180 [Ipomoea batatas]
MLWTCFSYPPRALQVGCLAVVEVQTQGSTARLPWKACPSRDLPSISPPSLRISSGFLLVESPPPGTLFFLLYATKHKAAARPTAAAPPVAPPMTAVVSRQVLCRAGDFEYLNPAEISVRVEGRFSGWMQSYPEQIFSIIVTAPGLIQKPSHENVANAKYIGRWDELDSVDKGEGVGVGVGGGLEGLSEGLGGEVGTEVFEESNRAHGCIEKGFGNINAGIGGWVEIKPKQSPIGGGGEFGREFVGGL